MEKDRRGKMKSISLFVRVSAEDYDELKKLSHQECRTLASLVRQAIREFLIRKNPKASRN